MRFFALASVFLFAMFGGDGNSSGINSLGAEDGTQVVRAGDPDVPPITSGDWYRPTPEVTWQWQLSGRVNISYDVEIYDIDLFDSSEALIRQLKRTGKIVICYFSGGSYEEWRPDADRFIETDLG